MTIDPVYLLPPPNPEQAPLEPVAHLLEALEHIAQTFRKVERDPERVEPLFHTTAERREQLYHNAASNLANTYPEDEQRAVYDRHSARYPSLNTAQARVAALALHGLVSDRAVKGTRQRDAHTWEAAAIAALEHYRNRKPDRTLKSISNRVAA